MKPSRFEQETVIRYDEEDDTASVYTHNNKLAGKLRGLAAKHPGKIVPVQMDTHGAVLYTVPKRCISVREPYSDERREADSQRAKSARIMPPRRSIRSISE